jgi:CheY-specific phosphatase CheX
MAQTATELREVSPVRPESFCGDVTAVMGLAGERGDGFVGLTLDRELAANLVARLLSMDPEALSDDDVCDGIGELINMTAGAARSTLLNTPYSFKVALPNVITGTGHKVSYPRNAQCWTATLETEAQRFQLLLAYAAR